MKRFSSKRIDRFVMEFFILANRPENIQLLRRVRVSFSPEILPAVEVKWLMAVVEVVTDVATVSDLADPDWHGHRIAINV